MNNYTCDEDRSAAFMKYVHEIALIPLITPEEEIALAERIQLGDLDARTLMIRSNLRLVVKLAFGYTNLGLPLLDLIAEGNIGLMKAVDRFDPSRGAKLSTYAIFWIKQSIRRALQNHGKVVRLPAHFGDKVYRLSRIASQMTELLGRQPTDDELSDALGLTQAEVTKLRRASLRAASLDAPIIDSSDTEFGETIGDERERTPFEMLREKDLHAQIGSALNLLTGREQMIINTRFGLGGLEPRTFDEIGDELGITRERVRQLQGAALTKLRHLVAARDAEWSAALRSAVSESS
jgi:RNA polymerase primary sigma factor